jgi:hypothetical protein
VDRTTCSHAHMGSFNQRPVATQKVYLTPRMTAVAVARALTRQAARAARMLAFAHKAAGPRRALVEAVPVPTQRRSGEEGSPSDASARKRCRACRRLSTWASPWCHTWRSSSGASLA